jgi:hypothetical protein
LRRRQRATINKGCTVFDYVGRTGVWVHDRFAALRLIQQTKIKKLATLRRTCGRAGASRPNALWKKSDARTQLYLRPRFRSDRPVAGRPADRDMPKVGTFTYCGASVPTPASGIVAAIGQ